MSFTWWRRCTWCACGAAPTLTLQLQLPRGTCWGCCPGRARQGWRAAAAAAAVAVGAGAAVAVGVVAVGAAAAPRPRAGRQPPWGSLLGGRVMTQRAAAWTAMAAPIASPWPTVMMRLRTWGSHGEGARRPPPPPLLLLLRPSRLMSPYRSPPHSPRRACNLPALGRTPCSAYWGRRQGAWGWFWAFWALGGEAQRRQGRGQRQRQGQGQRQGQSLSQG